MTSEDIKALRRDLNCTTRELAGALGVGQDTILAWERAELFPTKRHTTRMQELLRLGPSAIPRKLKGASSDPFQSLSDP